jgi:hypothetical protein
MERPTDLGFASVAITLDLRQRRAEPPTKEVGHVEVYNHHCLRSPRDGHRRRGVAPGQGRVFYLTTGLKKLLADQRKAADRIQRRKR